MSEAVRVPVGDCRCPGHPHTEDWVDIEPALNFLIGAAAFTAIEAARPKGESVVYAATLDAYLSTGIRAWSFVDAKDEPVPISKDARDRLLPFHNGALTVANAMSELYSAELLGPFLAQTNSSSSPTGPTDESTSARSDSGAAPRKRSKESSPNGTAGMEYVAPVP